MPKPQPFHRSGAVFAELIAPLLHARPQPGRWRLASWDFEQGLCVTLALDDVWLLVEFEERDDARECLTRTARFNVCARYTFRGDTPLDPFARRAVEQLVALVRSRERLLPAGRVEAASRRVEAREIVVDRLLVAQAPGHYYLNPYAGCTIGCAFCYVAPRAALSRRLEGRDELPWGRYVDVKVNAAEVLRREVAEMAPGIVRMSPILTDPYQPIEKTFRITRSCLEVMVGSGFEPCILTRGGRIQEDIDLLRRFRRAVVGLSIPTDDDAVRAQFEPLADPIEERIAALAACHRAGLGTVAVVQPMLPMNPERLAELIAPWARAVRIDRMYELPRSRHLYERAGRLDAAEPAFFEATERRLREALARRGVVIDPLDELSTLFA